MSPHALPSWPKKGNHSPLRHSPLRHASNVSNSSSEDAHQQDADQPAVLPRPGATSSPAQSHGYRRTSAGQKRTIRDTSPTKSGSDYHYNRNDKTPPSQTRSRRPSLQTLSQGANIMVPPATVDSADKDSKEPHLRGGSVIPSSMSSYDGTRTSSPTEPRPKPQLSMALSRSDSRRAPTSDGARNRSAAADAQSPQNVLDPLEFQKLGKSTTGHLRTLSKIAQNGDVDFKIASPEQEVVGLHGRRRLQRDMSQRGKKAPGYGGRTWMDQQRQFLQAYEYLCHIGEAKEWIEDIIHKPIPPIVQLEEALRDGVTLAEVVQALRPQRTLRIFQHTRLQFRHSDNIAHFFKYLAEVELPELFRFELVDLYEKKNIPKVIYCIHALSWLLFRKGIVDFRIGNLVGQLEFEQHELEKMQQGLDKAGVSMPNFSGMSEKLGAGPAPEPEPEPIETEEERIDRELAENEVAVLDFQAQARGALLRIRLGEAMQSLWDSEEMLVRLQSRIRGDFARQISDYRTQMRRFAVDLQKMSRGFIVRSGQKSRETHWRAREKHIVLLQSLVRAKAAKAETKSVKILLQNQQHGIKQLQAAARGALGRWSVDKQWNETRNVAPTVVKLQAKIRGALQRKTNQEHAKDFKLAEPTVVKLQTLVRASRARAAHQDLSRQAQKLNGSWAKLQALSRSRLVQSRLSKTRAELSKQREAIQRVQAAIQGYQTRQKVSADIESLQSTTDKVVLLQAQCRGFLHRSRIGQVLDELESHATAVTELQGVLKGIMVRNDFADMLEAIEGEEDAIVQLQAAARANLVRSKFAEKQKFFNENMKKVIKIQSFVRGRQQGQAYKSLTSGQNPPVGTVKNFVHLLNDNDFDFQEELESKDLQKKLVETKQKNEQTEQWIADLDAKIGLLAHTKIASDELAKMRKHNVGNFAGAVARQTSVRDSVNLKGLSKSSRAKLDRYQELFFILQSQPQYFARLFKRARQNALTDQDQRKLESLTLSAFAHAQKRREEYFLLKLVARSAKEEIDSSASLEDYMRGSFFFSRLFTGFTIKAAGSKDRSYMKKLFGTLVSSWFIDNAHLDLESDPLQIHRAVINDEELRTGRRSDQNLDVPREEAIKDPRIRSIFISHLQDMRSIVEDLFCTMEETVAHIPYGTRYIAREMLAALQTKFPRENEDHLLHIVGNWLWRNYLKPAVADPEGYGVVTRGFDPKQRRNLGEFLKVMNQIAAGRPFGEENIYLQPLNTTVDETIGRYGSFLVQVMDVPDAEQKFDISEFNDLFAKVKPTLYIRMADMFAIHHMVANDISSLCISRDDNTLRTIVNELGDAKANEADIGGGGGEITLSLGSKFHAQQDPDADIKTLFMETKRCVLFIIRIQSGKNLLDIMVKPVTADDESRWEALVREEAAIHSGRRRAAYMDGPTNNLEDISSMSYVELKQIALENILSLEKAGRLSRHNQYQDLLNEIAVDIRNKHRRRVQRQRELENVRTTIVHLEEKQTWLDDRLKVYNDTFEQNVRTLQDKSTRGSKFVMPFSKQWHHMREMERLGNEARYGSYKRAAERFKEKGILLSWDGHDLRNNDLTIRSDDVNKFVIEGSSGSINITGAHADFSWDDLLDAEYEGRNILEFFSQGSQGGVHAIKEGRRQRKPEKGVLLLDRAAFKAWMSKKFFPDA